MVNMPMPIPFLSIAMGVVKFENSSEETNIEVTIHPKKSSDPNVVEKTKKFKDGITLYTKTIYEEEETEESNVRPLSKRKITQQEKEWAEAQKSFPTPSIDNEDNPPFAGGYRSAGYDTGYYRNINYDDEIYVFEEEEGDSNQEKSIHKTEQKKTDDFYTELNYQPSSIPIVNQ